MSRSHETPIKSEVGCNYTPAYEWKVVALVTICFGLVGLDRNIIAPLFPAIMRDLSLNYADLGNLIGIVGLTWGIFALIAGGLSDRFGRRVILVPAVIGFSLMAGVSGFAASLGMLLLLRAIMGVTEGAFTPTSFATLAEASKPARLGFNNGLQQSAFPLLGLGLGPIIATQLLLIVPSWRWVFFLVAIPGFIIAVLLWFTVKEPGTATERALKPKIAYSQIFKHRNVMVSMVALFGNMSGVFVLAGMLPNYLTDYIRLDPQMMGFVVSAVGFGGFLGQAVLPGASDVVGRKTVLLLSFIGATLSVYILAAVGRTLTPIELFALIFAICLFCFANLGIITGPIAVEAAPAGTISTVVGIIIGAGEVFGGAGAPAIAGNIAQHYGIQSILMVALSGFLIGMVATLFLKETAPRKISAANSLSQAS